MWRHKKRRWRGKNYSSFEEELHLMGYDDVKQKMVKKELEG